MTGKKDFRNTFLTFNLNLLTTKMSVIDFIIGIPILWFGYRGFKKGFISELAMLAALLLGTYAAINFSALLGEKIGIEGEYKALIAFVITFLIVLVLTFILGKWIEKLLESVKLGFVNKFLGFILGAFKTVLVISIAFYSINQFDESKSLIKEDTREKSWLYAPVEKVAPFVFSTLEKLDIKGRYNQLDAAVKEKVEGLAE